MSLRLQARIHLQPAAGDSQILKPADEITAAELGHPQLPKGRAVAGYRPLQRDDAVGDAVQLGVDTVAAAIVKKQHRAVTPHEELLQGKDLPTVAQ